MISFIRLLYKNDAVRAAVIMFSVLFALPTYKAVAVDASILPQGVTQFLDDDGNPLSNGKVYFYVPTTLTFKTTWQNAAKSITNTNPVDLDAGGRAIIYGDGSYRQIVKDSLANTIYDAVTTAPLTGGSAALVGDGNLVSTVLPWSGLTAPAQYVFGYGQEIARATYPEFYTAITSTQTVGCTLSSPTITGLSDTSNLIVGTTVELSCVAPGTTVLSKTLTTATLSNSSSVSTTASATFFPWGNGNGSTTFNVPDLRGYNLAGRDNMGGTASARLVNGNGLGRPLGIANFTYTDIPLTTQTFLSGTSATYTRPSGVTKIVVTMVGGGGGGAAVVTNAGAVGTDSTWVISGGTNWVAENGTGGAAGAGGGGTGGTGGTNGSIGTLIVRASGGIGGSGSVNTTATVQPSSGFGGSTPFGIGTSAVSGPASGPPANSGAGGGGGGGAASTSSGSGGGGGEYVKFSIDTPASTYTYTVGTGGAAGAAGTNAGADGAAGRIYVEEYYTATTSFTATIAGTLEQQRTINYVVKVTPDTSTSIATGVASLGGMTGVISCGTGLLCTGNVVSFTGIGPCITGYFIGGTGLSTSLTCQSYLQTGTGAVDRTWLSKNQDIFSVKDFGAIGNTSTNDTVAITAANLITGAKFVPLGTYATTLVPTDLTGPYWGFGQIRTGAVNTRGSFFSAIKSNSPYTPTNEDSPATAFNGTFTGALFPVEHRITGAATLTQPTSGYIYSPWATPHYTYLYNESGWNNGTADNSGRTAATAYRTKVFQTGQGDAVAYNAGAFVTGTRAGSTSFLANPAAVLFNGDMTAGAAGVFLNAGEFLLTDAGFDTAGIGWVVNLDRSNATGAKDAWWSGIRIQSIGSADVNAAFTASGKYDVGLDFSNITTDASKAWGAIKANDRLYLNSSSSNGYYATSLGTVYAGYNSGSSAVDVVLANSIPTLRLITAATPVNFVKIQSQSTGVGPVIVADGETNVSLILSSKGTGQISFRTGDVGPVQFRVTDTASATRNINITGSNGGNPVLSTTAGGLEIATNNAHTTFTGTTPTLSAGCNGAGSSVSGSDAAGTVTGQTAAATTCTITFATAYSATPNCVTSGQTSPLTGAMTPSTTTLIVNFGSTANFKWSYICFGS